jgi:hypothetical protein
MEFRDIRPNSTMDATNAAQPHLAGMQYAWESPLNFAAGFGS